MDASPRNARDVFLAAIKLPAEERTAYLREACGDDQGLYQRVTELLQAQAEMGSFHEAPAVTVDHAMTESPGAVIGPYKLLEQIGEGGMGTVWMAQQTAPVKRAVAVKVVKAGMDSKAVLARFEAERQALAMMDHPNIAKVLDAGTTETGRPYFVMELVKGVPITTFCDQRRLTTRERLELFVPVCRAIQHAHQKGIIHRDIKPSNVLVCLYDDLPVPKVIDFGVAKATGPQLTEATLHTGFGAVVGTPTYMSPEQASLNQLDIDTRSDVYSLGVLLYELLVGSPPFPSKALKNAGLMEMLRVIREEDPPKPSTKLSTDQMRPLISANRRTEPRTLSGILRNELDWVVMKALEKDRARRYDTADGLALDIQCYLAGEAVAAVPPSMAYRLRKFVRKNRGSVAAALIVLAVLLCGIIGTTWGMIEARIAKDGEAKEREKVEEQRNRAIKAHQRADEALLESRKLSATLALDNGIALCGKGDVAPGLLWLIRALEIVPAEAVDLERVIRINLGDWRHELQPLHYVLRHPDTVFSLDLAPDGQALATVCGDKRVRVWDLRTGKLRFPPLTHKALLEIVRYSPDGHWLATADEGVVRIWDAHTGQAKCDNLETMDFADALAFSPNSEVLAAVDIERQLKFWKVPSGELLFKPVTIPGPRASNIAFRPDGKFLVVANRYPNAEIVEVSNQKLAGQLSHASGTINNVAFSKDGRYCVTVGKGPSGQLWDARTFKALPLTISHEDTVYHAVFSPDGKRVATAGADQTVRLWNLESGQPIGMPMMCEGGAKDIVFSGDGAKVFTTAKAGIGQLWDAATAKPIGGRLHQDSGSTGLAMTADATLLITSSWDGLVKVWRNAIPPRAQHILTGLNGAAEALEFSRDGKLLAAGDFGTCVHLWDATSGKRIGARQGEGRMVWSVAFNRDGSKLVSACDTGKMQVWDTTNMTRDGDPMTHQGSVNKVIFHPRTNRIYTSAFNRTTKKHQILAWDLSTRKPVGPEMYDRGIFYDMALSPDGTTLVVGDDEGAMLFDAETGKLKANLLHDNAVLNVQHRRGLILTCSADKTAAIWDTTGRLLHRLPHQSSVQVGAFSHKDDLLATGGMERDAIVWRVSTGKPVVRLLHPSSVTALAWEHNDSALLTGCEDGQVRLWDVATGRVLGRPQIHQGLVRRVAISSQGKMASAGLDNNVRLWQMPMPWTEPAKTIRQSIQHLSGMSMNAKTNATFTLDAKQWKAD